jgi:hypothetical protein
MNADLKEQIDAKILPVVEVLNNHGFKTFESCEGGEGHCFPEPTVRFEGNEFDAMRAYEICQLYSFPVHEVKRVFRKTPVYGSDNTPNAHLIGEAWEQPFNEITFLPIGVFSGKTLHQAAHHQE